MVTWDDVAPAGLVELAGEAWACRAPRRLLAERSSLA
jgi:hypothetical protein